jgi:hypothetical protein
MNSVLLDIMEGLADENDTIKLIMSFICMFQAFKKCFTAFNGKIIILNQNNLNVVI